MGRVELRDSKDEAVRKKMDYSGAVVWLDAVGVKPQLPIAPPRVRMTQRDKVFSPHTMAITVGTTVDFPNFDPIFHNVFSNYDGQPFDLGLYQPGSTRSVTFTKAGVVRVFCNIHASMSAAIAVLDRPFFAVSEKNGSFKISGIPDGDYRLRLYHERAGKATLDALGRRVSLAQGDSLTLAPIAISESGYIAAPHLNKFGHDYGPPPDDSLYPAARK